MTVVHMLSRLDQLRATLHKIEEVVTWTKRRLVPVRSQLPIQLMRWELRLRDRALR